MVEMGVEEMQRPFHRGLLSDGKELMFISCAVGSVGF